ncbi:unnamed protein product [Ectocarpus sp. 12 AP-2014]
MAVNKAWVEMKANATNRPRIDKVAAAYAIGSSKASARYCQPVVIKSQNTKYKIHTRAAVFGRINLLFKMYDKVACTARNFSSDIHSNPTQANRRTCPTDTSRPGLHARTTFGFGKTYPAWTSNGTRTG